MNLPRLICYIDEAGCSGGKYGAGSSQFLTLGAVVYDRTNEASILALFDEARAMRKHDQKFKKFSKGSDADNFVLTKLLATKKLRIAQVALHKPSMDGSYTRSNHQEEFQYLCKFMIERVSWIARDSAAARGISDTKCEIIFSEQKMYPYDDLKNYFKKLRDGRLRYNTRADWQYLAEEIGWTPHENEKPVHLADITASAIFRAVEPRDDIVTDDRFQRNLHPLIYRSRKIPYGLKLFPTREIEEMKKRGCFSFMKLL